MPKLMAWVVVDSNIATKIDFVINLICKVLFSNLPQCNFCDNSLSKYSLQIFQENELSHRNEKKLTGLYLDYEDAYISNLELHI